MKNNAKNRGDDPLKELLTPPRNTRRHRPRFGAAPVPEPVEIPNEDSKAPFELTWSSPDLGLDVTVRRVGESLAGQIRMDGRFEPGVSVAIVLFGPETPATLVKTVSLTRQRNSWVGEGLLVTIRELRETLGARIGLIAFVKEPRMAGQNIGSAPRFRGPEEESEIAQTHTKKQKFVTRLTRLLGEGNYSAFEQQLVDMPFAQVLLRDAEFPADEHAEADLIKFFVDKARESPISSEGMLATFATWFSEYCGKSMPIDWESVIDRAAFHHLLNDQLTECTHPQYALFKKARRKGIDSLEEFGDFVQETTSKDRKPMEATFENWRNTVSDKKRQFFARCGQRPLR